MKKTTTTTKNRPTVSQSPRPFALTSLKPQLHRLIAWLKYRGWFRIWKITLRNFVAKPVWSEPCIPGRVRTCLKFALDSVSWQWNLPIYLSLANESLAQWPYDQMKWTVVDTDSNTVLNCTRACDVFQDFFFFHVCNIRSNCLQW